MFASDAHYGSEVCPAKRWRKALNAFQSTGESSRSACASGQPAGALDMARRRQVPQTGQEDLRQTMRSVVRVS